MLTYQLMSLYNIMYLSKQINLLFSFRWQGVKWPQNVQSIDTWGLPVGFLLLGYSVLFTVESLSCFIFFLYIDLYVLGDSALIS